MNEDLKISVITPSFNQSSFLEETIRSVLCQDYPFVEHIVIDGCSTDDSVSVIKKYSEQIAYWISENDTGQSNAINKGIKIATGDIVCWLNSDDLLTENSLQSIASFFKDNPEANFVYGDGEIFFSDKQKKNILYRPGLFHRTEIFRRDPIQQPSAFWRRKLHRDIGFLDESLHYTMDWDFFARIAQKHELYYLPETLSRYRIHEAHKTGSGASQRSDEILNFIKKYSDLQHIKTFSRLYPHVSEIRHLRNRYGWRAGRLMFRLKHPLLAISEYGRIGASMDMY